MNLAPFTSFALAAIFTATAVAQTTIPAEVQQYEQRKRELEKAPLDTVVKQLAEAKNQQGLEAGLADNELVRRLKAGDLTQEQIDQIVDQALAAQADRSRAFGFGWENFVEQAHALKQVSAERWKRYALGAVALNLKIRPKIRRGDHFVLSLDNEGFRCYGTVNPPRDRSGFTAILHFPAVLYYDESSAPVKYQKQEDLTCVDFGVFAKSHGVSGNFAMDPAQLAKLNDGPHTARLQTHLVIYDQGTVSDDSPPNPTAPPLGELDLEVKADWELLPASTQSVTLNRDPKLRDKIEWFLEQKRGGVRVEKYESGKSFVTIWLEDAPPIDVAFEVFVRNGKQESPAGSFHAFAGNVGFGAISNLEVHGLNGDKFDVIFRPSIEEASRTMTMTRIWGEEVVLRDLPAKSDKIMVPSGPNH